MKSVRNRYISVVILFVLILLTAGYACAQIQDENEESFLEKSNVPEYSLLFFRDDNRIWIIMPPKTTFVMVYQSSGNRRGFVKCIDKNGNTLAMDPNFSGSVLLSDSASRPSLDRNRIVVTRYDGDAIGFYTPKNASFIEVINARNGFDGVVTVLDRKKRILNRQTGLDIQIVDLRIRK